MPKKIIGLQTPYGEIVRKKIHGYYLVEGPKGIFKRIEEKVLFPKK